MTRRHHRRVFWVLVVVLAALHVDFFNHGVSPPPLFGWLPVDLAYHMIWVIAAAALVLYFTRYVWRDSDGS